MDQNKFPSNVNCDWKADKEMGPVSQIVVHVHDSIQHRWRPRASYQICQIAGWACACKAGTIFPATDWLETASQRPGMHQGTCVTHVPWCMSGSLTRGGGENFPGIPGACSTHNLRIWQEAHKITESTCPHLRLQPWPLIALWPSSVMTLTMQSPSWLGVRSYAGIATRHI